MKWFVVTVGVLVAPGIAQADGYVMGSGRWTCSEAVRVFQAGTASEKGQLAGWILGFWSAATFQRETGFIDTVERVGGTKIANATIDRCREVQDKLVFHVVQGMIQNTK